MVMADRLEKRNCHDCGAKPGELHSPGCDVERCVLCGGQSISCNCLYRVNGMSTSDLKEEHPDIYKNGPSDAMEVVREAEEAKYGGRLPWTGIWPGTEECIEFGWYSKWSKSRGWIKCDANDPEAGPDLNRLGQCGRWDPVQRRYFKS